MTAAFVAARMDAGVVPIGEIVMEVLRLRLKGRCTVVDWRVEFRKQVGAGLDSAMEWLAVKYSALGGGLMMTGEDVRACCKALASMTESGQVELSAVRRWRSAHRPKGRTAHRRWGYIVKTLEDEFALIHLELHPQKCLF